MVEGYKGTAEPSEVEKEIEKGVEREVSKTPAKGAKKPRKRQTEVERLGDPVEGETKSRRSSGVKVHDTESLNRAEDSAD